MLGDLNARVIEGIVGNARVGNEVTEGIVGRHGVPGRNKRKWRTTTGDVCRAGVSVGKQLVQEKGCV